MKENLIAVIKDGIIDNVIVASDDFANSLTELTVNVTDKKVGKGWKHNPDNTFSHPDTLLSEDDLLIKKTDEERQWRDSELLNTDKMVTLPDFPKTTELKNYRQDLRDYPDNVDFPNGSRPINL